MSTYKSYRHKPRKSCGSIRTLTATFILLTLMLILILSYTVRIKEELDKYKSLYESYRNLYSELNMKYRYLAEEYENTRKRLLEISRNYTALRRKFVRLEYKINRLERKLEILSNRALTVLERLKDPYLNNTLARWDQVKEYVMPSIIRKLGLDVDYIKSLSVNEALKIIFEAVVLKLEYYPDDIYYFISPTLNYTGFTFDRIALPNETVMRGGGDCEDLAILLYSLIDYILEDRVSVYLIELSNVNNTMAHIAVLVKYGERYIILDPAGNYVTLNSRVYIKLHARTLTGTEMILFFTPIQLNSEFKQFLISQGVARGLYYKPYLDNYPSSPYKLEDFNVVVVDWLRFWSSSLKTRVCIRLIANSTYVKIFKGYEYVYTVGSKG